jgi:transcriptional regulator with XRE-family HTH domain
MMNIQSRFGLRLREIRLKSQLSQEKFASLVGIDRTYVASIELGKRNVSLSMLEKIATALNLTISDLVENI